MYYAIFCPTLNKDFNNKQKNSRFSCARKKTVDITIIVTPRNGDIKIMQFIRITSRTPSRKRRYRTASLQRNFIERIKNPIFLEAV